MPGGVEGGLDAGHSSSCLLLVLLETCSEVVY